MDRASEHITGRQRSAGPPDERLRLLTLARGEMWPEREVCEIVLVLDCRARGFTMTDMDETLCVGETALLPLGDGLISSAHGRVISARMEQLAAPPEPQRLTDSLIARLLRRAWASVYTARDVVEPSLSLIEVLITQSQRAHQERLDFLDTLDPRIARVLDYIEVHFGEGLTVAELADVACLSPGHFSRLFKASIGDAVWTYVQSRRCERAKEMLLTTQSTLSDIAYACGFAHQGHFTQCFRKQFDVTPGQVRNEPCALPEGTHGSCQSD
ncbi:AraC family transcriptional regulator [Eilatimonas milleporae]|uniref:Helix-turn-helix protein n=1 Tax=Eilatimonas milleporae TaxID=911205 RepID=A0A3M0C054_9PROT|nr:AraC family transcriptional regulator [Eilatimonas milleporae]RMB02007.1 helix-turn-helix protein [Eilatimonas milleporae]